MVLTAMRKGTLHLVYRWAPRLLAFCLVRPKQTATQCSNKLQMRCRWEAEAAETQPDSPAGTRLYHLSSYTKAMLSWLVTHQCASANHCKCDLVKI